MNLLNHCFFINLDERLDRLRNVKNELSKIGCENPERVPAVKMENGAIGCTISHIKCLELAKERNYPQVFICEDDIVFLEPKILTENIKKFSNSYLIDYYKVLIIGGNNCPPYYNITKYCIKVLNCQTTLGYIVKQKYYDKLIANMKEGLHFLLKDPTNKQSYAIDIYWKKLQQQDDWYMLIPATVTQMVGYSNIENKNLNYNNLMLDIDKKNLLMSHGIKFTPTQIKGYKEILLGNDQNKTSSEVCKPVEDEKEFKVEVKNIKETQFAVAGEGKISETTCSESSQRQINNFDRGSVEFQNEFLETTSIEFEEHKKRFAMVLNTIHIIPLFYNIKTYFDFILTESELDIENLIKICKKEWKNSSYDFSNYTFTKYLNDNNDNSFCGGSDEVNPLTI
jgi:glycosyl transferase family 25